MPESNGINLNRGTATLPTYSFVDDTNTGVNSSAADSVQLVAGGAVGLNVTSANVIIAPGGTAYATYNSTNAPMNVSQVALVAGGASGGSVISWANPTSGTIFISRVVLDITTVASTGGVTIKVGVAANGTTSAENLIDDLDINAATGVFDNIENGGTDGRATAKMTSSQFLTGTPSGAATGLVGTAYIYWHRA